MTKLVGIINVTPDSFSDGGSSYQAEDAVSNIKKLVADGADIIDIGAESTRPNAIPIPADEEWARLEPVLSLISGVDIKVSVDTYHPQTAKSSLNIGVGWINDVSGLANIEMVDVVKDSDCKLVVMHSLTVPANKNVTMEVDCDPVEVVLRWAERCFSDLEAQGIKKDRIIFDPGIGFGKTAKQSYQIIEGVSNFKELGVPILVGHSRKSFMGVKAVDGDIDDETIKISKFLIENGVDYLRVHNVKRHKEIL
ncbi:MAG: dihydropteroate synthase [Rickettsiales bacterium]